MAKIVVTGSDGQVREFDVDREMTLGRHDENDIVVREEKASRRHCRVSPKADRVLLEDLNSSNGTRVNDHKIKAEYLLKHGDTITIGGTKIVFQDESQKVDRTATLPNSAQIGKKHASQSDIFSHHSDVPVTAEVTRAKKKIEVVSAAVEERVPENELEEDGSEEDAEFEQKTVLEPKEKKREMRSPEKLEAVRLKRTAKRNNVGDDGSTVLVKVAAVIIFATTVAVVAIKENEWHLLGKTPVIVVSNGRLDPIGVTTKLVGVSPTTPPLPVVPVIPLPTPIAPPVVAADKTPVTDPAAGQSDAGLQELFTAALAERDRALNSLNYQGAHAVILSFASKHSDGPIGARAKQEWKDTDQVIASALESELNEAKTAANTKKYSTATRYCTRIMSSDPSGKFGSQARDLLQQLDDQSEPRFTELQDQGMAELRAAHLPQAAESFGNALDELSGTKWAAVLSADQIETVMAESLLQQIELVRMKKALSGKEAPLKIPAKKIDGVLTKVSGVNIEVRTANGPILVPIKALDPAEMNKLLDFLELPNRHLEQSYLWLALDRKDAAKAEMERALQDPAQAPAAAALAVAAFELKNLYVWDFSKWQHQSDWDVTSGSWSTQKGRYVLESSDGGDTSLRTAAIGGPFPAKNARISFDFDLDLKDGKPGYAFIFEFGSDEQHTVSAVFTAAGLTLNSTIGTVASAPDPSWKPGTVTHVDISIQGDIFSVNAGGNSPQSLQVKGLSDLQGTITFRARETACTIGTVILRGAE